MFSREVQKLISSYEILGFIPLDKALHFAIGMIFTICLRLLKQNMKIVFGVLLFVALIKEIIDLNTLQSSIMESIWDTLITLIYPTLILGIIEIKKRSKD